MSAKMKIVVRSLSDQTYEVVRRQILLGNLMPGAPVRQDAIALELGVSKIPLREALSRLEQDGLLTSFPNRGYVVRDLSSEEATEVFALRLKLEPAATAAGSLKATAEDHRYAQDALAALEAEMKKPEGDIVTTNHVFHMALIRPGAGLVTFQIIDRLHVLAERYVRVHLQPYGRDARAQQEHRDLLNNWLKRKSPRVETLSANHLQGTLDDLLLQLKTD
jgi:DNA-binding GntR family transcriptional regulator